MCSLVHASVSIAKLQLQCLTVNCRGRRTKQYSHNVWRVGVAHPFTEFIDLYSTSLDFSPVYVEKFYRIELNSSLYYCREYKRTSKTNNFTILYKAQPSTDSEDEFAIIDFFVEVKNSRSCEPVIIAVVQHLNTSVFTVNGEEIPHLFKVSSRQTKCIPVASIKRKCILIESYSSGESDVVCRVFERSNLSV